jgi:hypothetical protein
MLSKLFAVGLIIVVSLIIGLALLNLMIGCGQTVYYENGTWETLDCLFIPYETAKGEW